MTAEQRAGLSDAALAMTQPCIDELIKDISRRVQKAGAMVGIAKAYKNMLSGMYFSHDQA